MERILEELKVAFVILSKNQILKYSRQISEFNLQTLKIRYPDAYDLVSDENTRKILVLTGLYEVAPWKVRSSEGLEIQFTDEVNGPSSYTNINRFREAFVGSQNLEGDDYPDRNWNFKESEIDISGFENMSEIKKLIESFFLLISKNPNNNGHAYYQVRVGKLGGFSKNTKQGFENICHILLHQMKPNERRIRELFE
jgi:hypothetical protein